MDNMKHERTSILIIQRNAHFELRTSLASHLNGDWPSQNTEAKYKQNIYISNLKLYIYF